jgi:hypothetical protein
MSRDAVAGYVHIGCTSRASHRDRVLFFRRRHVDVLHQRIRRCAAA